MGIPSLIVNGYDYGQPDSQYVIVWSGPVKASGFDSLEYACEEIKLRRFKGDSDAYQPTVFELNEDKTKWIEV